MATSIVDPMGRMLVPRTGRGRLILLGNEQAPRLLMSLPFDLPDRQVLGFAMPNDEARSTALLQRARATYGSNSLRILIDTEQSGTYLLGATTPDADFQVAPADTTAFLSEAFATSGPLRDRGWHLGHELRILRRAHSAPLNAHNRLAWETHHVANVLLIALFDRARPTTWIDLGVAVQANWKLRDEERTLVSHIAKLRGSAFQDVQLDLAVGGCMVAISDLRDDDRFRVRGKTYHSHALRLPDLARAFLSRAVSSARGTIGYDRAGPAADERRFVPADALLDLCDEEEQTVHELLELRDEAELVYQQARDVIDRALLDRLAEGLTDSAAAREVAEHSEQIGFEAARKRIQRMRRNARAAS